MNERDQQSRGLTTVIEAFQAPLLRYAARLLNNATLAQDVVQNTLLKLVRRVPPVSAPTAEVRNWLFRVAHNEAVDLIRSEERKKHLVEKAAAEQSAEMHMRQLAAAELSEREQLVLGCIEILPPLQRQVVLLRLQQGMNYEEIGAIMGVKSGYVGNLLHHAVKALAAEVKRREGEAVSCVRMKRT